MTVEGLIEPDWPAPPNVRALVTTRAFGDLARGASGIERIAALLPAKPAWLRQVHGTTVLDAATVSGEPQADASVARTPGVVCVVRVADCMPVLFADTRGRAVGIAHAGWRGLSAGVLERTVEALDVAPDTLVTWLGPAIGPEVYEVGADVRDAFVSRDPQVESAFTPVRAGHWLLDLYAAARRRLERSGVRSIHGGGFCTYSEPARFFSHRRGTEAGRMAALVWLA